MLDIHLISLCPERLKAYFDQGVLSTQRARAQFRIQYHQLRDHSHLKHAQVDDHPFGGKHGMLLRADVAAAAIVATREYERLPIWIPCPQGPVLTHDDVRALAAGPGMILLSPAYEGIDARLYEMFPVRRFSCGDYIMSSGDVPALALCDAVLRLVPGVLGNPDCRDSDSIASGLLAHPQYTQPRSIGELTVPALLCGGHHQAVAKWKWVESLKATLYYRPDLLLTAPISVEMGSMLERLLKEPDYEFDHYS